MPTNLQDLGEVGDTIGTLPLIPLYTRGKRCNAHLHFLLLHAHDGHRTIFADYPRMSHNSLSQADITARSVLRRHSSAVLLDQ